MTNQLIDFECKNLSLELGGKSIFQNFQFRFSGPGIVLIEGENGTGKSSLLKVLAGFIKVADGQILYSGRSSDEIDQNDLSYLTTTSLGLLNDLTGREHIEIVARALKLDSDFTYSKIIKFQTIDIFKEILDKPVANFSQGMKQLLRLFLHLFFEPAIVFLDEPFLYLSPKLKEYIQHEIEQMSVKSLIFITDQKFTWTPVSKNALIRLGVK